MNLLRTLFVFLLLTDSVGAAAQAAGNYQYGQQAYSAPSYDRAPVTNATPNNGEVLLRVNGLMNIVADNYVAVFNLTQMAETAGGADTLMQARIAAFGQRLRAIGVDAQAVTVDMISMVPRYEVQAEKRLFSKTYNEVPAGFELQKNVMVRYRTSNQLDQIVTAAAASEIYDLVKVDYFIVNTQKDLDSLRGACIQAMRTKIRAFETLGIRLDTQSKVMAEGYSTVHPSTRYASYQAFSRPSMGAASKRAGSDYTEASRSTSRYYSPVSYDGYDLVINPVITEPVVQMSYSLTLRYSVPDGRVAPLKLLTPSGELVPIPMK